MLQNRRSGGLGFASHSPVQVAWFTNRVEIASPGGPYGDVSATTFGQPDLINYRNPNLAEAMRISDLVQRYCVGIPIVRRGSCAPTTSRRRTSTSTRTGSVAPCTSGWTGRVTLQHHSRRPTIGRRESSCCRPEPGLKAGIVRQRPPADVPVPRLARHCVILPVSRLPTPRYGTRPQGETRPGA